MSVIYCHVFAVRTSDVVIYCHVFAVRTSDVVFTDSLDVIVQLYRKRFEIIR
jgi:hypothetical protein